MELKYRPEIDGLRTLAVLPVIFFHAGVQWIPGGFLGVDVFFVISGFLITSILLKECSNRTFTFSGFYERRVRRIAPALILMTSVTFIISLFMMVPYDLKNLGQSVVATIFSANNILLYLTSGYWSTASEFKPLYHTWSLAVEEQYYLVAPVIIYIIYSINHNKLIKNSFMFL
ncbi:acyltransferase, partial [Escherichia coli]|nr:acyltransferase [Escherichia coli]